MPNTNTKSLLFILSISFFSFVGNSQNMDIKGTVYDTSGINPLPNAIVMAVRVRDSLLLGFSHTNKEGTFTLNDFPVDTFSLIISYPRCDDKTYYILGNSKNSEINITSIKMLPKSTQMEEVIIYANRNPIYYKGDTLVYVADSFKVAENAVVEDLLRKLPGIKIEKDGKIKSQGKDINQVLVDGDEFFGGDATIATKNLAADGIKTVEVYEKKDESGGDETTQILNLTLKEDAKKGYFGRVSAASDFQNFYQGEFLANKYNGTQKLSVFVLSSNTPRSSFDWQDQNRYGLSNEGDMSIDEDGNTTYTTYSTSGIPKTVKAGVYFSDKIGKNKKTKIGFNYTFNDSRVYSNSKSRSQYFLTDTTYFADDSTSSSTINQSHLINIPITIQADSLTTINISPRITFSNGNTDNLNNTVFLNEVGINTRTNNVHSFNDSKGITISNEASTKRKFIKPKRELTFVYKLNSKVNETNGNMVSSNLFFDGFSLNDTIDQHKLNQNTIQSHNGNIYYLEPLTKKLSLSLEYMYEYLFTSQNKETKNKIDGEYSLLDMKYSNSFESVRQQNRFGTSLIYRLKKHTIEGGFKLRNIEIVNTNNITTVSTNQNFNNILPRFTFVYTPSQNKRLSFHYTTTATQPSINHIQPIPDNTNPNRVVIGNTSLKPSYSHNFKLNFNNWGSLSGRYVYAGVSSAIINNDFANSTTYDPIIIGKMTSKTENVNGNLNGNLYCGAGIPIYKKIIELNPRVNANYSKMISFINEDKNITQTRTVGGNLGLSYDKDSIQISLEAGFSYSSPLSSISSISNNPFTTTDYAASINWILPGKFKIITDVTYTINGKRANGYNINYFIWNAQINRSFLKTENLVLSIMGNDILNQNILTQRYMSSNVITDYKTKIISRYFLLKLTMKFNNNKTKEQDENW